MNRLIFSLFLGTSLIGLQAFAMDDVSPAAGLARTPSSNVASSPDLGAIDVADARQKFNILNISQGSNLLGDNVGFREARSTIELLESLTPEQLPSVVEHLPAVLRGVDSTDDRASILDDLYDLGPEAVTFATGQAFLLFPETMTPGARLKMIFALEEALKMVKPQNIPVLAAYAARLYPQNEGTDRSDIIPPLAHLPQETLPLVVSNASFLFGSQMDDYSKRRILLELSCLPSETIPHVLRNASDIFTQGMYYDQRIMLLDYLNRLSPEKIIEVAQNASILFTQDMDSLNRKGILEDIYDTGSRPLKKELISEALTKLDPIVVTVVFRFANLLFTQDMKDSDKKAIIEAIGMIASALFTKDMDHEEKLDTLETLGLLSPEIITAVAPYTSDLFPEEMSPFSKAASIKGLGKFSPEIIMAVGQNAFALFREDMDYCYRFAIINALANLPKDTIPIVVQNASALFGEGVYTEEGILEVIDSIDRLFIIATLGELSPKKITAVAQNASVLFTNDMDRFDRVEILEDVKEKPLDYISTLVAKAQKTQAPAPVKTDPAALRRAALSSIARRRAAEGLNWTLVAAARPEGAPAPVKTDPAALRRAALRSIARRRAAENWTLVEGPRPEGAPAPMKIDPAALGSIARKRAAENWTLVAADAPAASRPEGLPAEWTWQGYLEKNPGLANMFGRPGNKERFEAASSESAKDAIKEDILMEHFLKWGQKGGLNY